MAYLRFDHHSFYLVVFSIPLRRVKNVYKPTCGFFQNILHAEYRAATDVYALMFLTDVVDFIIVIFGFWAFGVSTENSDKDIPSQKNPKGMSTEFVFWGMIWN